MKVSLFVPCFIDQFYPKVAISVVEVLEGLGHTVECPKGQTCCGQPPFNSGYWDEARPVARHCLDLFEDAEVVVIPSGSCGAMLKVFYKELFAGTDDEERANELSAKTWEFSEFLTDKLNVDDVGAKLDGKATFHDGCHGLRELGVKDGPRKLLANVEGLELIEMGEGQTCCGFGGTFAVKFPEISTAMAEVKCDSACETGADYVISNDSSCLMQIQGYFDKNKKDVKCLHLAEVLASK